METNVLITDVKGAVATLTFNRPDKRNSLSVELLLALARTLEQWARGDEVRVVVIRGAGDKAFSGGFDVSAIPTSSDSDDLASFREQDPVASALAAVKDFPYPTIAMINGYALGMAFNLAMCCDLRIAADDARMGIPPAKLGLVYPPEGLRQVVEAIGMARAREAFFTGRLYGPDQVMQMGLAHQMVARDELVGVTYELAEEIAANAPLSLKGAKRMFNMLGSSLTFSDEDRKEAEAMSTRSFFTADAREGQLAFLHKRKPNFTGK